MYQEEFKNNIDEMLAETKKYSAKTIFLQIPEGLKTRVLEIASTLENSGYDVIINTDPCWGACDLRPKEAEMTGADLIVHIGHKQFIKPPESDIPILYLIWRHELELDENRIINELAKIEEQSIGLISSVQYESCLQKVCDILNKMGKKAKIGGYVLGCWHDNANMDTETLLFIGSGNFHSIGAKCKYILDIERAELRNIENEIMQFEKKRFANIEKARDAETFCILVSSKPGQFGLDIAKKITKRLNENNKKAFILIMDEITDAKLLGIRADAFINTACPRIVDNCFSKPFINIEDLDMIFGD